VVNSVFIENINHFNSIGWTFSVVFLLCLALRYLYKLYDDLENIQLGSHPLFIINTGFLIYFTGSLFTYIFGWEILSKEARGFFHNAWIIQSLSNIGKKYNCELRTMAGEVQVNDLVIFSNGHRLHAYYAGGYHLVCLSFSEEAY